jgi:hypothetical protein
MVSGFCGPAGCCLNPVARTDGLGYLLSNCAGIASGCFDAFSARFRRRAGWPALAGLAPPFDRGFLGLVISPVRPASVRAPNVPP